MVTSAAVLLCIGDQRRRVQMAYWLDEDNYEVEVAATAAEALAKLAGRRYACLLLDLLLPGVSGLDVLPIVRSHYPRLPVIALTDENSLELERTARVEQVFYYLVQPDREELKAVLRSAADQPQQELPARNVIPTWQGAKALREERARSQRQRKQRK